MLLPLACRAGHPFLRAFAVLPAVALLCLSMHGIMAQAEESRLDAADRDLLERTAEVHRHDSPTPTPMATTPPLTDVVAAELVIGTVDGRPVRAFLARPRSAVESGTSKLPGIVLIHEWWGLNDNIRDEARRLAGEGYAALAVDLYDGQSADAPPAAIKLSQALTANPAPAEEKLRQAVRYLEEELGAPRIGTIGWCLGGRWSLRAALLMPERVDATVIYYGSLRAEESELARLDMPILGIFASRDPIVPLPMVEEFRTTLQKLGKDVEVRIYDDTEHGFANPSGGFYDAQAAEDAWRLTTAFFRRHLAGLEP